jgi:serine phosphatase RsbU (regulator of sigma subunit)
MKWTGHKLKFNLRLKIALLFIVLIVISVVAVGVAAIVAQYQALVDDTGKRLTSFAHYAASHIDGDDLVKTAKGQSEKTDDYRRVQKELQQVVESANKMPISQISEFLGMKGRSAGKYLKAVNAYTLTKRGDTIRYGADAITLRDKDNQVRPGSIIHDPIEIRNVEQIYSGVPYFASEPYSDRYGTWITGYARVFDSNDNIAGVICVDASIEFIYNKAWDLALQIIIFGVLLVLAASFLSFYLSKKITEPLIQLNKGAEIVGNGELDYQITVKTGDEIEDLANAFNKMAEKLKAYIEDLRVTTAEKERIQSELKVAHNIQTSMLPRIFPPFPDREEISIYGIMEPAKEVGGDFFDFFFIDKNKLCFVIGDVSGKGVPAALFMVITKTLLKNQALLGSPVHEILYTVNNLLCSDNEEMMFVTVFLAILNTDTGELQYANGGHNPPLVTQQGGFEFLKCKKSFVLGGIENFTYRSDVITLEKGDAFFMYTDGVTEAMNAEGAQFTDKKLKDSLAGVAAMDEREIVTSIRHEMDGFVKETPQSDDITMLTFRYHGPK